MLQTDNPSDSVVFGSADKWKGLGVFLDSFDNDGQVLKLLNEIRKYRVYGSVMNVLM